MRNSEELLPPYQATSHRFAEAKPLQKSHANWRPTGGLKQMTVQLAPKIFIASSTEAPSQMMAWQAAVILTASSVGFW